MTKNSGRQTLAACARPRTRQPLREMRAEFPHAKDAKVAQGKREKRER
jgi:hypothetical protein